MLYTVTTENGSIYELNSEEKTWKRISETQESGKIRTNEGQIIGDFPSIAIGFPLIFETNLVPGSFADKRFIQTSLVTVIKEK